MVVGGGTWRSGGIQPWPCNLGSYMTPIAIRGLKRKRIFTLTSYNFCVSPPTQKLGKMIEIRISILQSNLFVCRSWNLPMTIYSATYIQPLMCPFFEALTHADFFAFGCWCSANDRAEPPSKSTSFPPFPWFPAIQKKLFPIYVSCCMEHCDDITLSGTRQRRWGNTSLDKNEWTS